MDSQRVCITVSRQESYTVTIGFGVLENIEGLLVETGIGASRVFVVIDSTVADLHLDYLLSSLDGASVAHEVIAIPSGEAYKSASTYLSIIDELATRGMQRRFILLLVGGGVIMDMGGFVGATFMRGVPVVNIPTTLLAQVDASIGGKVAVNHRLVKNLIGAFYNPRLVIIDPYFLTTLSQPQFIEGLAEVIKVAVIASPELFDFVESNCELILQREPNTIQQLITMAVQRKADLLFPDPLEISLERTLNFGHTLAHPLETISQHKVSHGEAVAIGIASAVRYAVNNKCCSASTGERILSLLWKVGLPTEWTHVHDREELISTIQMVARIRNGAINFVVPSSIGEACIVKHAVITEIVDCLSS